MDIIISPWGTGFRSVSPRTRVLVWGVSKRRDVAIGLIRKHSFDISCVCLKANKSAHVRAHTHTLHYTHTLISQHWIIIIIAGQPKANRSVRLLCASIAQLHIFKCHLGNRSGNFSTRAHLREHAHTHTQPCLRACCWNPCFSCSLQAFGRLYRMDLFISTVCR